MKGWEIKYNLSGVKEILCVFAFALIITCLCRDNVNTLTVALMPKKEVSIIIENAKFSKSGGTQISILCENYPDELFEQCRMVSQNSWKYFEGVLGESWTALTSDMEGASIIFDAKPLPNSYIAFLGDSTGGELSINVRGGAKQIIDTYSDEPYGEIKRVYPFANSYMKIFLQFIIYFFLFFSISFVLFCINYFLKTNKSSMPCFLKREIQKKDILWIWILLYVIAIIQYKVIGIPNYLQIGDECGYWQTLIIDNGKIDMEYLASLYAPRGYWCYIFQTIAKYAGNFIHVDAIFIWLLFPSFFISWLSSIILPEILYILGGKKASIFQTIIFLSIFLYVWLFLLTCVTMDLFGVVTLYASLLYMLRFFRERQLKYAILAGILSAMSCSFRIANKYGFYVIIILAVLYGIKLSRSNIKYMAKKYFWLGLIIGIFSFFMMCLPQYMINAKRGHIGFLPYDHDDAWFGRSQVEWSADYALTYGSIAYPIGNVTDAQMVTMKSMLYHTDESLNMTQILDVFAQTPLESLMFMFKKLLIGFDIKTNIGYPNVVNWRLSAGMIYSFINYFILFSGFYILLFDNKVTRRERYGAGFIFLTIVLPETLMKIEWRYILAGYLFLYYIFAYYYIGENICEKKEYKRLMENSNYMIFMIVAIFLMFCFSFSLCA